MDTLKISILFIFFPVLLSAQDSLLFLLDSHMPDIEYVTTSFKSSRVINHHTVERPGKGDFEFRIHHRFGYISEGIYDFFGLDYSSSMILLDYGVTDYISIGLSRSTWQKTWSGYSKVILLRQTRGKKNFPFTFAWYGAFFARTNKWEYPDRKNYFWSRFEYFHQLIAARKFSSDFSLQVSPSVLHRNLVETRNQPNDIWSMAVASRYRLSKRIAVTAEYDIVFTRHFSSDDSFSLPLSVGVDIETGGHVFQLLITNSGMTTDNGLLYATAGQWQKGQIRFGFNISRAF